MNKINPCLWFDGQAEEAAKLYTSIFPDSGIDSVIPYPESAYGETGTVMLVNFHLRGQKFMALNGGPQFPHTHAISMSVLCETQEEIDRYWNALIDSGGEAEQCGWLRDKFGVCWQIVPTIIEDLMGPKASEGERDRVMAAVMKMVKLDIATLKKAA